ncbi:MAG: TolC family protein, partial [Campylobacter sp.]|nr:TolC family protein [Campylobacter sp.]
LNSTKSPYSVAGDRYLQILEFERNLNSINSVKFLGVDLEVPFLALSNRPDVRQALANLNSGFYNYKVSKLNFFPSITLGAGLNGSGAEANDAFDLKLFNGSISISLPFLDYPRLKQRLKISELAFEKSRVNYEKTLSNAVNEVRNLYELYGLELKTLENLQKNYKTQAQISEIYRAKYDAGAIEFRDYINAETSRVNSMIDLLSQRYNVLNTEIAIYKAMAGKFSAK